jgi:hypothetical protein
MSNFIKIWLFILLAFSLQKISYSQDPPIEWGEIPMVDLEMKSFPKDTNATAVILCDYGESHIDDDFNVEFNRILRVKILNSNGFKWGSCAVEIISKDDRQEIYHIKGATYNLDENRKVIKSELDDDDIFKEDVDEERTRYRFTLPNLKPGCIVEMTYRILSKSLFLMPSWTFQHDEPVLWSEYRACFPPNIIYAGVYEGYEPWYYNQVENVNRNFGGTAASILGNSIVKCHQYRYIVKDAPAIRDEPYVTTVDDYVNRLDIQLSAYFFPNTGKKEVLQDWKSFVTDLLDNDYFYKKIDVTGDVEDLEGKITAGLKTPIEKMKAIYNWVSKSIVWDGKNRMHADNDVDDVIQQKKGNSSEINFLLLSLLKSAGISGDPVILSTRDNGLIQKVYPVLIQFNYTIAKVLIDNKTYFLDATNPYRPFDLLPKKILGVQGLVIKDSDGPVEWVTFSTVKGNQNKTLINIKLNPDGSLTGDIADAYGEYKSLSVREDLTDKKDMDIAKELFKSESEGFTIDSVSIENKDSLEMPLEVKSMISSSVYAQKTGEMIYLNPFMVHRLKENPFKTKERKFPVDYGNKSSNYIIMNIILPEGYELKEPFVTKTYAEGENASYSRQASVDKNRIQILSRMDIKNPIINSSDYDQLRTFYSQIVSAESEQLVIGPKKNGNSGNVQTNSKSSLGVK